MGKKVSPSQSHGQDRAKVKQLSLPGNAEMPSHPLTNMRGAQKL
jgi:hypothetical protein